MGGFINTSRFQMNLLKFNYNQGNSNMKFLKLPQVIIITGLSRSSLYSLVASGNFPKQIPLGARSVVWLESEVQEFMQKCIANRRGSI